MVQLIISREHSFPLNLFFTVEMQLLFSGFLSTQVTSHHSLNQDLFDRVQDKLAKKASAQHKAEDNYLRGPFLKLIMYCPL